MQKKAIRVTIGANYTDRAEPRSTKMKLPTLRDRKKLKMSKYVIDGNKRILSNSLMNIITANSDIHTNNTRNNENTHVNTRTNIVFMT